MRAAHAWAQVQQQTIHGRWTGPELQGCACVQHQRAPARLPPRAQKLRGAQELLGTEEERARGGVKEVQGRDPNREIRQRPVVIETRLQPKTQPRSHPRGTLPSGLPWPQSSTWEMTLARGPWDPVPDSRPPGRWMACNQTKEWRRPGPPEAGRIPRGQPGPSSTQPQPGFQRPGHTRPSAVRDSRSVFVALSTFHSQELHSVPHSAPRHREKPGTPSRLSGPRFPPPQRSWKEMVSRSLQAPTRQDFLPQWMGSRETEAPRLILSGV